MSIRVTPPKPGIQAQATEFFVLKTEGGQIYGLLRDSTGTTLVLFSFANGDPIPLVRQDLGGWLVSGVTPSSDGIVVVAGVAYTLEPYKLAGGEFAVVPVPFVKV